MYVYIICVSACVPVCLLTNFPRLIDPDGGLQTDAENSADEEDGHFAGDHAGMRVLEGGAWRGAVLFLPLTPHVLLTADSPGDAADVRLGEARAPGAVGANRQEDRLAPLGKGLLDQTCSI